MYRLNSDKEKAAKEAAKQHNSHDNDYETGKI